VGDGDVFNIACGQRITLNNLLKELAAISSKKITPNYQSPRPGDVKHSLADISRAQKYLGFKPQVALQEGLRKTVDWFSR